MPRTLHQAVVGLLRDDPRLGFDLVRSVFGFDVPHMRAVHDRKGEIDRIAPSGDEHGELRPDLVLSAVPRARKVKGMAMVVEVQRKVARMKRWRMWVYWALVAERLELVTIMLMVSLDESVSRWARSIGKDEIPPREGLLVLDRQNMPRITSHEVARQRVSMAVLSALLHPGDLDVLHVAFDVARELEDDRRWRYLSALMDIAPRRERKRLKGKLTMAERYELTEAERNSITYDDGRREGLQKGLERGLQKGLQRGLRQAKREGLIELVLTILELRAVPVDDAIEARIRNCKVNARLERWAARAKSVERAEQLFGRGR